MARIARDDRIQPFHMITRALRNAENYTLTVAGIEDFIIDLARQGDEDAIRFLDPDNTIPKGQRNKHYDSLVKRRWNTPLDPTTGKKKDWMPIQGDGAGVMYRVSTYVWDANKGYSEAKGKKSPEIAVVKSGRRVSRYIMENPRVVDPETGRIMSDKEIWRKEHPEEDLPLELQDAAEDVKQTDDADLANIEDDETVETLVARAEADAVSVESLVNGGEATEETVQDGNLELSDQPQETAPAAETQEEAPVSEPTDETTSESVADITGLVEGEQTEDAPVAEEATTETVTGEEAESFVESQEQDAIISRNKKRNRNRRGH